MTSVNQSVMKHPKKSESDSGQMSIFDYFANDDEKETNDGTASDHKMTQTGMGTDAVDTSFTVHQGDASLQMLSDTQQTDSPPHFHYSNLGMISLYFRITLHQIMKSAGSQLLALQ